MEEKKLEEKLKAKQKKKEDLIERRSENKKVIKEHKLNRSSRPIINMMSKADMVKGQGVLAVYEEQVKLIKEYLSDEFDVVINSSTKADIVHYHTYNPEFIVTLPSKNSGSYSVGYVHYIPETVDESLDLPDFIREVYYFYTIQFYKAMDYLVVVNPCFIDPLVNKYGMDKDTIFYVPNFVSDEYFHPISFDAKQAIRKKYGIAEDCFVVLGVGQLQTRKGVMDFYEIAKSRPDIQFVWAGGFSFGMISDGDKEIKKVTEEPPANLKFLGIIEREGMSDVYNMADVMFLPSYAELFPMSILEAMSCHIPILIRDLDIYPEILFDFYLKANDNEGFIKEIDSLKNDKDYYAKAKAKAIKGSEYYAREHIAELWRDVYHTILRDGAKMRKLKKDQKKIDRQKKKMM